MKNAELISRGILYIAIPIAFLNWIDTYVLSFLDSSFQIINIQLILDYVFIFIISTIGSLITKDKEDGMLAGFYGSSLALIIWLGIQLFSAPLVYFVNSIMVFFTVSNLALFVVNIVSQVTMQFLLIYILYKQKLRTLQITLLIMFIVGYIFPIALLISVEWGYMASWSSVIHLVLYFLVEYVALIIISTISGLFGGWIGMNFLIKYEDKNSNYQQIL
ncbi:MAG: hypothetical protein ACFE9Q_01300 [Candidatus Hodarchaeota archaeon]